MISKFPKQPYWFAVSPARVARDLDGLSCYVVVRESVGVRGIATIKFDPGYLLPNLGAYLPVGIGPAHPGYLSVNHVWGSLDYRVMVEYIEEFPVPQLLWEQKGHPDWVKQVRYN